MSRSEHAPRPTIGIVGAGNMGGALVERLCELGWSVVVHDIDAAARARAAAAGARVVAAAHELGPLVETVILLVVTGEQAREVLVRDGLADSLGPGAAVWLSLTLSPADVEHIAALLDERGIACVDAPVSGGPARARDGTMSLMLAGPDAVIEAQQDLVEALSSRVFRLGARLGDASRTKLVNNMVAAVNLAGAAEGLALARHWGLDPARTLAVMEQSSGQSWIGSDRLHRALADDYAPRAHTTLLAKDTRLALEAAEAAQRSVPLAALAAILFAKACHQGYDALDDASLYRFFDQA